MSPDSSPGSHATPDTDALARGGSFVSPPTRSRSAARQDRHLGDWFDSGFRLVLEISR